MNENTYFSLFFTLKFIKGDPAARAGLYACNIGGHRP